MRFLRSYSVNYGDVEKKSQPTEANDKEPQREVNNDLKDIEDIFRDGKLNEEEVTKLAGIGEEKALDSIKTKLSDNSLRQSLENSVKGALKKANPTGDQYEKLIAFAKRVGLQLDQETTNDESKKVHELGLKGELDGDLNSLDKGKDPIYYKGIGKNKTKDSKEVENSSEISEALTNIEDQINEIDKFTSDANKAKLPVGNKLGDVKEILEKFKHIIGNTTPENVKILQNFIFENLGSNDERNKFKDENRGHEKNGFDGKFGSSTLEGLNGLLEKTKNYISQFENKKDEKKEEKKKNNTGSPVDTSNTGGNGSGKKQEAVSGIEGDSRATVETLQPVSTEPLTLSDNGGEDRTYLVMENSQQLAQNMGLSGVTFYSAEAFQGTLPVEGGQAGTREDSKETRQYPSAKPNENGDYECYVKIDSPNDNRILKLKFDKNGDVCPVMKVAGQNEGGILLKNNESCMRYLYEKLPNSVKKDCVIGWDSHEGDYEIISHDTRLTIEPMTIAGDWVVDKNNDDNKNDHLNKSLALLNFTNMLRSGGSIDGIKLRGTDPDIKLDGEDLYVRVEKSPSNKGEKWYKVDKAQFGLKGIKKPDLKRFKKYNNHEDWWDDYDRRPNVGYQKIDAIPVAPSVKAENKSAQKPTQTDTRTSTPAVTAVTDAADTAAVAGNNAAPAGNNAAPADNNAAKSEVKDGEVDNAGNKDQVAAVTGANPAVTENLNATDATKPDKQYDIGDIPLKQVDFENMNKDLGGKNFLSIQDDKVILDKQKLVDFLNNDVAKHFKEYRNLSKGNERTVGTGKRRALHSAVQIILNLLGESLKLKIDGKWIKGKDYDTAIKNFQNKYNESHTDKLNVDGIPGPKTIAALIEEYNKKLEKDGEAKENGKIENAERLGLSENSDVDKTGLNIPVTATVYKKAEDSNGLYYKEGSDIVRVSTDEPWIKRTVIMPSSDNASLPDVKDMKKSLHVCDVGTRKLNDSISNNGALRGLSIFKDDTSYVAKFGDKGEAIKIADKFFLEDDYFGQSELSSKFSILLVETKLKNGGKSVISSDDVSVSSSSGYKMPDGTKVKDFIDYYNEKYNSSLHV